MFSNVSKNFSSQKLSDGEKYPVPVIVHMYIYKKNTIIIRR